MDQPLSHKRAEGDLLDISHPERNAGYSDTLDGYNSPIPLLPCPFCGGGAEHHLALVATEWNERRKVNKLGRTSRRAVIRHRVECYKCGMLGPASAEAATDYEVDIITQADVYRSLELAAVAWNVRDKTSKQVFSLIAKAISGQFGNQGEPHGNQTV